MATSTQGKGSDKKAAPKPSRRNVHVIEPMTAAEMWKALGLTEEHRKRAARISKELHRPASKK